MQTEKAEIPTALPHTTMGAMREMAMNENENKLKTILGFYSKNKDKFSDIKDVDLEILKQAPLKAYRQLKDISGDLPIAMVFVLELLFTLKQTQRELKELYDKHLADIYGPKIKEKVRKRIYARKKLIRKKLYEAIEWCEMLDSCDTEKLKAGADIIFKTTSHRTDPSKPLIDANRELFVHCIGEIFSMCEKISPPGTKPDKIYKLIAALLTSLQFVNTRVTPYKRTTIRKAVIEATPL